MKITVHSEFENDNLVYNHYTKTGNMEGEHFTHYHDVTEVIFIKSGDVAYSVGGKEYALQKNMLILSRPNESHRIDVRGDEDYERYDVLFDDAILPFDLYGRIPRELNVISFEANKSVMAIFDKMDVYCKKLKGEDLGRMIINLISEVLMNVIIETEESNPAASDQIGPIISRAVSYIEEHLLSLRDIDEVCRELYLSKSHLHHLFMEQMKISPKKYITEKRLELARREITLGAKATEIYESCGFADYSSFFRAYKKHFGHSPAQTPRAECVRISFSDFVKGYKA